MSFMFRSPPPLLQPQMHPEIPPPRIIQPMPPSITQEISPAIPPPMLPPLSAHGIPLPMPPPQRAYGIPPSLPLASLCHGLPPPPFMFPPPSVGLSLAPPVRNFQNSASVYQCPSKYSDYTPELKFADASPCRKNEILECDFPRPLPLNPAVEILPNSHFFESVNDKKLLSTNSSTSDTFSGLKTNIFPKKIRNNDQSSTEDVSDGSNPPLHPLQPNFLSRKIDQDWVEQWLKRKQISASIDGPQYTFHHKVTLSDVHRKVADYRTSLLLLKNKESSENEKLTKMSEKLLNPDFQETVRRLVSARRGKRLRARRCRKARRDKFQQLHNDIDEKRKQDAEKLIMEQLEGDLKASADKVLREVRIKQQEVEGMQLLLAGMRDLRQHRLNMGAEHGHVSSERQTKRFDDFTANLDVLLENQLREYALEEHTLLVMIQQKRTTKETSEILSSKKPGAPVKNVEATQNDTNTLERHWFGESTINDEALYSSYTAADTSSEILMARRAAWDQYIVKTGGSGIPVSWVSPNFSDRGEWSSFLICDQNKI